MNGEVEEGGVYSKTRSPSSRKRSSSPRRGDRDRRSPSPKRRRRSPSPRRRRTPSPRRRSPRRDRGSPSPERDRRSHSRGRDIEDTHVNTERGAVTDVLSEYADAGELAEVARETELDKTWKLVNAGNADFVTWTRLLTCADNEKIIEGIRKAYDRFLQEYPLCYVYWKRYADHEVTKGSLALAKRVYERGVTEGIPHSVDLWTFYCGFVAEKSDNLDEIRALFERALKLVQLDYASHPLWDQYIAFEASQDEFQRVNEIYTRVLHIPLEQIATYWHRYKQFVKQQPLENVTTAEELKEITGYTSLDTDEKRKNWLIAKREPIFKKTNEESDRRKVYENEVLKISYFHVRPLSKAQLTNWDTYLTWEEKQGDHARIVNLYERCVIPCCNYIQFWLRYIKYAEDYGRKQAEQNGTLATFQAREAVEIFEKCCARFLKSHLEMHQRSAVFLEYYREYDRAAAVYEKIRKVVAPGHIESILRYVALERRRGDYEKCAKLFKESIASAKEESHKVLLYIHFARFLASTESLDAARDVFDSALVEHPQFKSLWHAYLSFEKKISGDDKEERVNGIYARAVHGDHSLYEQEKLYLLREWMEYLMDEGNDVELFRKLSTQYCDAITVGEDGHIRGLKRAIEGTAHSATDDPATKAVVGAMPSQAMMTAPAVTAPAGATTAAADPAYAAYYQQYYGGQGYDYSNYYANYAGYQWQQQ